MDRKQLFRNPPDHWTSFDFFDALSLEYQDPGVALRNTFRYNNLKTINENSLPFLSPHLPSTFPLDLFKLSLHNPDAMMNLLEQHVQDAKVVKDLMTALYPTDFLPDKLQPNQGRYSKFNRIDAPRNTFYQSYKNNAELFFTELSSFAGSSGSIECFEDATTNLKQLKPDSKTFVAEYTKILQKIETKFDKIVPVLLKGSESNVSGESRDCDIATSDQSDPAWVFLRYLGQKNNPLLLLTGRSYHFSRFGNIYGFNAGPRDSISKH